MRCSRRKDLSPNLQTWTSHPHKFSILTMELTTDLSSGTVANSQIRSDSKSLSVLEKLGDTSKLQCA